MDEVSTQLTRALGICAFLVEGGIDPFASKKAKGTLHHLIQAMDFLEAALETWRGGKEAWEERQR